MMVGWLVVGQATNNNISGDQQQHIRRPTTTRDLINEEIHIRPFANRKYVSDRTGVYFANDKDPRGKLIFKRRPL